MAVVVMGMEGLEGVTLRSPLEGHLPLEGSADTLHTSFFWRNLPDDLDDLSGPDRKIVEAAWAGMLQYAAGALAEIAHLDQTMSLVDFPTRVPRKWVPLSCINFEELSSGSPRLRDTLPGLLGNRLLQGPEVTQDTVLELTAGASNSCAYVALRGVHTGQATLAAQWVGSLRRRYTPSESPLDGAPPAAPYATPEAWFLFGYGDAEAPTLSEGVYAALSTRGRLASVMVRENGTSRWAIARESVPEVLLGEDVTLRLSLAPGPGAKRTVRAECGGRFVQMEEVVSFQARHLTLSTADTRIQVDAPYEAQWLVTPHAPFAAVCRSLSWVDLTVDPRVRLIPSVQPHVSVSPSKYVHGQDFELAWDELAGEWAELRWTRPIDISAFPQQLWAEYMGLDAGLLDAMFGQFLGSSLLLGGEDSEAQKNRMYALLNALLSGPHLGPLSAAISALGGVPVALEPGTVVAVNTTGVVAEIVVRGFYMDRVYAYPPLLRPRVRVGDTVQRLDMLVEHPVVRDWTSGDVFLSKVRAGLPDGVALPEVAKYAALHVEIPYGVTGVSRDDENNPRNLPRQIAAYLQRAGALWAGTFRVFLSLVATHRDHVRLRDRLDWEGEFSILTPLTNARDPRYNDSRRFVYDGTLTYNEADFDVLRVRLEAEVTNTTGAPLAVHVFGTDTTIPPGGTVTIAEPV